MINGSFSELILDIHYVTITLIAFVQRRVTNGFTLIKYCLAFFFYSLFECLQTHGVNLDKTFENVWKAEVKPDMNLFSIWEQGELGQLTWSPQKREAVPKKTKKKRIHILVPFIPPPLHTHKLAAAGSVKYCYFSMWRICACSSITLMNSSVFTS